MAGQESFFNTPVGVQRGVPPLRLEHGPCANTEAPSPVALQQNSSTIKEEMEILQEITQHHPDSSSSETNYHTRLVFTSIINKCSTVLHFN